MNCYHVLIVVVHKYSFILNNFLGRGSVIGHETGKILAYDVMSTTCAKCARGHTPEDHDCCKNHEGSAKSMEPACAVNLLAKNANFEKCGVECETMVGDEDVGSIAHVREATDHDVKKLSDINHVAKKFGNKLHDAADAFPFLTTNVINYLKRLFRNAIEDNRGDVEGLCRAFRNIAKHTFGLHDDCNHRCTARDDPNHIFKCLPDQQPFSCLIWRSHLQFILESYVDKAEQIAPGGSSQRNESFNHMCVTSPKSRFYGSSMALRYRVAAAVLEKNRGSSYLTYVYDRIQMKMSKT